MDAKVLISILLLFCTGALSKEKFTCADHPYLQLGICIIEDFNYDDLDDLTEDSFPNATQLEFRGTYFPYFSSRLFELFPEDLRQLTFRGGFVREINLQLMSVPLERLRVINTDLVTLDAVSEPNYSLKELIVRSPVFSRWSESLQYIEALELIDVAYCNFTFLDLEWFEGYENLRILDVSNNKLQTIASRPELTLPALKELFIWGNRLEFVWRFPDAFPSLEVLNLSDNLWRCSWVSLARDAIRDLGIVVIDRDYSCPKSGWVMNGGLCCQLHADTKIEREADESEGGSFIDYIVDEKNGTVIGMRMGNSVVYLDEPLPA